MKMESSPLIAEIEAGKTFWKPLSCGVILYLFIFHILEILAHVGFPLHFNMIGRTLNGKGSRLAMHTFFQGRL